jgi:hypothetical protein
MKHFTRAVALAVTLLLPAAVAAAQQQLPYTYHGTVRAVKAGTMDLITGVGYALRVVHMRTLSTTSVTNAGALVKLGDVQPGDIVRADCRMTDRGLIADRIEITRRGS